MKKQLFYTAFALTCFSSLLGFPDIAKANSNPFLVAQQSYNAPQIDTFSVNPVSQLSPGTELIFTLQGTPNSRATLTLGNSIRNLPMRETEPGFYEARYVIRSWDRLTENTVVRANLQRGNRISSIRLQQPLMTYAASDSYQINNYGNRTGNYGNSGVQPLAIDRFTLQPVQQIEPGTELRFTLIGTPNATATFSIDGVAYSQPMREVSQGVYQGQYVVRRQDYFPTSNARVTASLQSGNQIVRSQLNQDLAISNPNTADLNTGSLPLEIITPDNNSRVNGTVEVQGRSAPNAVVEVNVKATTSVAGLIGFDRNLVDRTIRTDAQGNFSFTFTPTLTVPGTRYEVSLNATQGNQTNKETLVLIQQ